MLIKAKWIKPGGGANKPRVIDSRDIVANIRDLLELEDEVESVTIQYIEGLEYRKLVYTRAESPNETDD